MISRRLVLGFGATPLLLGCQTTGSDTPVQTGSTPPPRRARPSINAAARPPVAPHGEPGPNGLVVVYVSAWNCPACPGFEANDIVPFLASPEARQVAYRKVSVPNLAAPFTTGGYWPTDLEWVRQHGAGTGLRWTPQTFLLRNQTVLEMAWAGRGWRAQVHPRLLRELANA